MAMIAAAVVVAAPLTISTATAATSPSRPSLSSSSAAAAAFLLLPSPPRSLHLRRPPTLAFFDTRIGSTRQRRRRLPAIVALASREVVLRLIETVLFLDWCLLFVVLGGGRAGGVGEVWKL